MASRVYFANFRATCVRENKTSKLIRLFDAAGFDELAVDGALTAVKLHFGESGNDCFLSPVFARAVVDRLKSKGAKPFLTDTNTLYSGSRFNAVDHMETAMRHGYSYATVGAPVIIADGLKGENQMRVPMKGGNHFREVVLAGAVAQADRMVVLSHFKGHELAGFGGAIKNLAMGCAPGAGKREQHTPRFEVLQDKCIRCGECAAICPVGAAMQEGDEKATIDKDVCIGCGECYSHCPEKAITIDWKTEIPPFMERMTEYAWGVFSSHNRHVGFINFLIDITPDCDCLPWSDAPIVPDIGILASLDPVAIDQASLDLVNQQAGLATSRLECAHGCGEDKFAGLRSHYQGEIQLEYGDKLGMGSRQYELVSIDDAK
ncbi:4Fe-4S ferredoxin [Oceanidesulfovibrio indonesiensis]|uniref:4Fe-4S ferredoxin n=1 Tax=Oceanidesulfovibrio indonesiensis TaxID=54767 RepID=A0A7M3MD73_9BACT|nr:DUF362 domain-containing protein [Oceanidesulfovibrio indonesiensis]TVM16460.1 4Fe-4S ferredoxin [Oceanidesulfovibrio indonesiensis]